jgi:hypothetical protein
MPRLGETPYRTFALLGLPRTGTTYLRTLLSSHPEVVCHGEILDPDKWANHFERLRALVGDELGPEATAERFRPDNWRRLVGLLPRLQPEKPVVGFKHMINIEEVALAEIVAEPSMPKILIWRDNLLASFSSALINRERGRAHVRTGDPIEAKRVRFDPAIFARYVAKRDRAFELCRRALEGAAAPFVVIEYRDLGRATALEAICATIGVDRERLGASSLAKQNSDDILSRFSEPDRVAQSLEALGRPDWAFEQRCEA